MGFMRLVSQMGLSEFTRGDPIFADEAVLRDTYRPDDLIGRDEELADYQDAIQPVFNNAPPLNVFLYGQTGVGKTAATRLILDRIEADQAKFDDLQVHAVEVNCKSCRSSYQVAVDLVNQFRSKDEEISSTGYPSGKVYSLLWEHLNALDATHCLIVLDEIDSIGSDDDILYELPRANDNGHVDDPLIGVIGISNDFTFRDNLSGRVKDSLCEEELHFPPYDAEQLRLILEHRVEQAFHDDVVDYEVIPLAAAFAAAESGSARQALKLMYKAGKLARKRGLEEVTETLVREAKSLIEEGRVKDELESLPTQSQLTLYTLLQLEAEGETPCKRKQIYERYRLIAKMADADIVTDRTIHDRLSHLRLKGFVEHDERNEGKAGGSYYLYELGLQRDVVEDALRENSRVSELFGEKEAEPTLDDF